MVFVCWLLFWGVRLNIRRDHLHGINLLQSFWLQRHARGWGLGGVEVKCYSSL